MSAANADPQDFALWLSGYADAAPHMLPQEVRDRLAVVIGALVARRLRAPSIVNPFDLDIAQRTFGQLPSMQQQPPQPYMVSSTTALAAECDRLLDLELEQKVSHMNRMRAASVSPVAYAP